MHHHSQEEIKKPYDEFEEDEDVEYMESDDCGLILKKLLLRLAISLVLIGCVSGAIVFSFINGESGESHHETHRDASKNFSIYVDQYTKAEGVYKITIRLPDGEESEEPSVVSYPSYWIQSDANQSIVHQISPNLTIYTFKDHAYWVRMEGDEVAGCNYDRSMNYTQYIYTLGLNTLSVHHSEIEQTYHHTKVFIYQGNPHEVLHTQVNQTAFIVTTYADAESGCLLGWDTYFHAEGSDVITELSYEYDMMASAKPDPTWFDPPKECTPTVLRS